MATRAKGGGRKAKPTKLHLLHGNPSKRNLDRQQEIEAEVESAIPPMPSFLKREAKKEWDYIAPKLEAAGLLSEIDGAALAAYCQTYGRWFDAESAMNKMGGAVYRIKIPDPETGRLHSTNEWAVNTRLLQVAKHAMNQMKAFLVEFGMTPSSRSRVIANKHEDMMSDYERWKKTGKK